MRTLLTRRPAVTAVVLWALMLYLTQVSLGVREDVDARGWATAVSLGFDVYGAAIVLYGGRRIHAATEERTREATIVGSLAVAAATSLIASGLLFLGAAVWSAWVAFAWAGVLLAGIVWCARS